MRVTYGATPVGRRHAALVALLIAGAVALTGLARAPSALAVETIPPGATMGRVRQAGASAVRVIFGR